MRVHVVKNCAKFSGAENELSDWLFRVKCHLSLAQEGFPDALERAEGNVYDILPGKARPKYLKNATRIEGRT